MRAKAGTTLFLLAMIVVNVNVVLASPATWIEVVNYSGSGTEQYTTDPFAVGHVEWRIRWNFTQTTPALFSVTTYPQGSSEYVDQIFVLNSNETSGISYIHNMSGTFYMIVNVANTISYSIVVEQDLDSVPEFPTLIVTPLFMIVTLLLVSVFRRRKASLTE